MSKVKRVEYLSEEQYLADFKAGILDENTVYTTPQEPTYSQAQIDKKLQQLKNEIGASGGSVDAYTKSETDALLEDKADSSDLENYMLKPTIDAGGYMAVPRIDHNGEQGQIRISYNPLQYALVAYNSGGIVKTNTPTEDLHCANKAYVDGIKEELQEQITTATGGEFTKVLVGGVYQATFDADTKANAGDIPTKTSELTNDSGFITSDSLPTKTSQLTNDSGFLTSVPSEYVTETELTNKLFAKQSDLDALTTEVGKKANQSTVAYLEQTVINSLINRITTLEGIPTLIYNSKSSASGQKNFTSSISAYREIVLICCYDASNIQYDCVITVPMSKFKETTSSNKIFFNGSNASTTRWCAIYYVSDTAFNVETYSMSVVKAYGIV